MIEYEERFAGTLPKEFFPLPVEGTYRKGGKPPFVALRALAKVRGFLDGLPFEDHRFPCDSESVMTQRALSALLSKLRRFSMIQYPVDGEEADALAVVYHEARLRRVMAQIETWDVAGMVVDSYLSTYQMMRMSVERGWNSYDQDFEPDKFVGFTNLRHVVSVFRAHRETFMAPINQKTG